MIEERKLNRGSNRRKEIQKEKKEKEEKNGKKYFKQKKRTKKKKGKNYLVFSIAYFLEKTNKKKRKKLHEKRKLKKNFLPRFFNCIFARVFSASSISPSWTHIRVKKKTRKRKRFPNFRYWETVGIQKASITTKKRKREKNERKKMTRVNQTGTNKKKGKPRKKQRGKGKEKREILLY